MLLLVAAIGFGTLVLSHLAPFPFFLEAFRPDRSLWHMEANPSRPAVISPPTSCSKLLFINNLHDTICY